MRKMVITLGVFVLIVGSCGQTVKKQAKENINLVNTLTVVNNFDSVEMLNVNSNQLLNIQKIDSAKYFDLKKNTNIQKAELEKLTNLEQVKEILKGRVMWGKSKLNEDFEIQEDEQGDMLYKIVFHNGATYLADQPFTFLAYYTQEDILRLKGEWYYYTDEDVIFDLNTGETTETAGNPEYTFYSPSKQRRLTAYFNGQIRVYFIQEKAEGQYRTIIQLCDDVYKIADFGCLDYITDAFWQSDTILNLIAPRHFYPEYKEEKFYFQLILK